MKEAEFYLPISDSKTVKCDLCPHNCRINSGESGLCGVRINHNGVLIASSYGEISSLALDPIEKKPLKHFHPGSMILSVGSAGCNLACPFCQNHNISKEPFEKVRTNFVRSDNLVRKAIDLMPEGNIGIAYTYNEPLIWYEYVIDTARLAKKAGLMNVLVTNGYINKKPLHELLPFIDAMNIDLKSFSHEFYRKVLAGGLDEVKETICISKKKCHVEISTLVIPGKNDSYEEIEEMAKFIAYVSPDIPLHLTRFFPQYKWSDMESTPIETLNSLALIAKKYLKYVYIGNV